MRILIITAALFAVSCTSETPKSTDHDREFQQFMDQFSQARLDRNKDELSAENYRSQLSNIATQLESLEGIDTTKLELEDKIDWLFARSILRGREIRLSRHQSWKKDPRTYMNLRGFPEILGNPGDLNEKVEKLKSRLEVIPKQLENGTKQIEFYIPRFQELSLFMAENAKVLFFEELPAFIATNSLENELGPYLDKAQTALTNYIRFLTEEVPAKEEVSYAMGTETYNMMLKEEFMLDYTDETLWEFGNQKFDETVSELEALAIEIDPSKTWQQLAVEIKNEYPDPYKMIEVHQEWMDNSKAHVLENNLIPIPWPERVVVVERAEHLRKTSYYGNFNRAKEKDTEGIFTARVEINPFEDQWDDKTKQEYLVEHDWGVIMVTAPHETYAGHHVQGLYQLHNPRKIRKENGISVFSEGWGLYNEQLMRETGFFPNKKILLRQLQLRLWRNARVIYDVGMHTGKMTYEEAIDLMTNRVGFLRWASQLEIDASSARPGYFIGYFVGMTEILKMREKYKARSGDQFTLSDFHEKLLKIGSMPPKLMARSLFPE